MIGGMPPKSSPIAASLRKAAQRLPDITEGVACAGTVIESRTFKVRDRAFLFLGPREARLKLTESQPEARRLAQSAPARVQVGAGGWTKVTLEGEGAAPPTATLDRWVAESHRAYAAPPPKTKPKKAVAKKKRSPGASRA